MPHPLTTGILLFLHLRAPCFLRHPLTPQSLIILPYFGFHPHHFVEVLSSQMDRWLPFCYIRSRHLFRPHVTQPLDRFDSTVCEVLSSLRFQGTSLFRFSTPLSSCVSVFSVCSFSACSERSPSVTLPQVWVLFQGGPFTTLISSWFPKFLLQNCPLSWTLSRSAYISSNLLGIPNSVYQKLNVLAPPYCLLLTISSN